MSNYIQDCWIVHAPYGDVVHICTNRDRADELCKQKKEYYIKPYRLNHLPPLGGA